MDFYRKVRAQQDQVDDGTLKVSVFTEDGTRPVEDALVRISYTGESGQTVEEVRTDSSGQTPVLDLKTPPKDSKIRRLPVRRCFRECRHSRR